MSAPAIRFVIAACISVAVATAAHGADSTLTTAHQATKSPMRYHVALPRGWVANREWPVLVVIPDAARNFTENLERFVHARGDRPFILVAPEVLSCGGARSRTRDHYTYTANEWDSLQNGDDFAFEDAGVAAVLADVRMQWRGESKAFLTGWEAGGHTVWAQAFRHPERWRGVAPVTPNYQRRGVSASTFSRAKERATLPIQPFECGAPTGEMAEALKFVEQQTATALQDARDHGFKPHALRVVPGVDHGPLPDAVIAWCDSLRRR
jgi:dienelactone hydrolase